MIPLIEAQIREQAAVAEQRLDEVGRELRLLERVAALDEGQLRLLHARLRLAAEEIDTLAVLREQAREA